MGIWCFFREIPAPPDSYQIYSNLLGLIEFINNSGTGRLLLYQLLVPSHLYAYNSNIKAVVMLIYN